MSTLINLQTLTCSGNSALASLDVTGLTHLQELDCSNNDGLQELHCSQNQITALNLNGLPSLVTLEITDNLLTTLNANNLTSLQNLNCSGNQLTSLLIKNGVSEGSLIFGDNSGLLYVCADAAQIAGVQSLVTSYGYVNCVVDDSCSNATTEIVNIPDPNFKAILLEANENNFIAQDSNQASLRIDGNNDGEIQLSEALQVFHLNINVSHANQASVESLLSLEGILSFSNLRSLACSGTGLSMLDLHGLSNVRNLFVNNNELTTIDLTGLSALELLWCTGNKFTTLDLTGFGLSNFNYLLCNDNPFLTSLNVAGMSSLQNLHSSYNPNLQEIRCNGNQLNALNLYGLPSLTNLNCRDNLISEFNISELSNLQILRCSGNLLTSLEVNNLSALLELHCSDNQLPSLEVNGLVNLQILHCNDNQLSELEVGNLSNLTELHCSDNLLTTLDLQNLFHLVELHCSDNQLETLFIKNGIAEELEIEDNPNLEYICADDFQLSNVLTEINTNGYINCTANTYCSFAPGGTFYTIQGSNKTDATGNGCDAADLPFQNAKFVIVSDNSTDAVIANGTGLYNFSVIAGTHTITPVLENQNYFNVTPPSATVIFPTQSSPFTQNFCYTPNGVHPDLEITAFPTTAAVPGFDVDYRIVFKNKGNTVQSGTINLEFDDAVLDFVDADPNVTNQSTDNLSWNFVNLQPFETREIEVTLNLNSPMEVPPVNEGDTLSYTATISSQVTDESPDDNEFEFSNPVINSFDPNDITCLEGETISKNKVGDYVHYMVRFENTGTYQARNIVIKDVIDGDKFDVGSLVVVKGSHNFYTNIKENKGEFIFENINLPFDDANNDGFVVFKIKTKPTLKEGDTFSKSASIFFDYNFPVETNTATTMVKTKIKQNSGFDSYFMIYPNPVKNRLTIEATETLNISSIRIYNQLGQLVLDVPNVQSISKLDVSALSSGTYFIKINSDRGVSNAKFIKQ
ncbi:hypothetical protein FEDK69T_25520 [Flavobacterium enshiense DK69]|nr:hypothetical protein FEDK69T_25520 [Flavobacterium enshiense DK69]